MARSREQPAPDSGRLGSGEGGPSFEEALAQVEAIIERIESGQVGLEQSIAEYERGVGLIGRCREVLARAEQRVEDLTARMRREGPEAGGETAAGPASGTDA